MSRQTQHIMMMVTMMVVAALCPCWPRTGSVDAALDSMPCNELLQAKGGSDDSNGANDGVLWQCHTDWLSTACKNAQSSSHILGIDMLTSSTYTLSAAEAM